MSEEVYALLSAEMHASPKPLRFCKVIMALSDLLQPDFFNVYIKSGTCLVSTCFDDV